MKFNETKNKWLPETDEEQEFFSYAFNKGFSQAKKSVTESQAQPEVANNTTPTFDIEAMQKMMAEAVAAAVAPIQQELNSTKQASIAAQKQSFMAKQETKLPAIYENLITGSNEAEWQTGYNNALEQYKADFKVTTNFGAPTPSAPKAKVSAKSFNKMSIQEKMEMYKNDPELYKQLQNKA